MDSDYKNLNWPGQKKRSVFQTELSEDTEKTWICSVPIKQLQPVSPKQKTCQMHSVNSRELEFGSISVEDKTNKSFGENYLTEFIEKKNKNNPKNKKK